MKSFVDRLRLMEKWPLTWLWLQIGPRFLGPAPASTTAGLFSQPGSRHKLPLLPGCALFFGPRMSLKKGCGQTEKHRKVPLQAGVLTLKHCYSISPKHTPCSSVRGHWTGWLRHAAPFGDPLTGAETSCAFLMRKLSFWA